MTLPSLSLPKSRRSVLAVPGSSQKMILKAKELRVDQVFLDLEDAVAPEAKASARINIAQALAAEASSAPKFLAGLVSIRINAIGSPWIDDDLALLSQGSGRAVDSVIFPKVAGADQISWLDSELERIEKLLGLTVGAIGIDAQIETAEGLVNVETIANSPRVQSLAFGPADFMADIGMPSLDSERERDGFNLDVAFYYPRMKILIAARAHGKAAIDGPVLEVRDLNRFRTSAIRARALGFDGKWVLHPDQISACNEIFTPSQTEFDRASELLEAYEISTSGLGGSRGAVIHDGAMIDEASAKIAQFTLTRGRAAGLHQSKSNNHE
jgi:citrate lyase subunit beta/citryl-CoA lyase